MLLRIIRIDVIYNDTTIIINTNDTTVAVVDSLFLDGKKSALKRIDSNTYKAKSYLISITNEEKLNFKIKASGVAKFPIVNDISLGIYLPEGVNSVSWVRNSLYNYYPSKHIGRTQGTAKRIGNLHKYNDKDLFGISWSSDMSAFSYYSKYRLENSLSSNDFRTRRLNIKSYKVNLDNDISLLVNTDDEYINAYANPFDSILYVGKCSYFPSLAWGNCFGKINKDKTFKFTLSISEE